jgi:hypothetical protein
VRAKRQVTEHVGPRLDQTPPHQLAERLDRDLGGDPDWRRGLRCGLRGEYVLTVLFVLGGIAVMVGFIRNGMRVEPFVTR